MMFADLPGIGGNLENAKTDDYIKIHAPGHYDFSIFMTSTRLPEAEVYLLRHLLRHDKPIIVIKTHMDSVMQGETDGEMENHPYFQTILSDVKEKFAKHLNDVIFSEDFIKELDKEL